MAGELTQSDTTARPAQAHLPQQRRRNGYESVARPPTPMVLRPSAPSKLRREMTIALFCFLVAVGATFYAADKVQPHGSFGPGIDANLDGGQQEPVGKKHHKNDKDGAKPKKDRDKRAAGN